MLFRPPGEGPFPLAVIAHASTQNVLRRAQMPQPEYRALAAWLVARGFAVLVPERPGHGATGGKYLEDQGGCDEADYARSGRATADEIAAAAGLLRKQSFIRPEGMVVIGHSAGAWGALALASEDPKDVAAIIAFAPGRGGHANDLPNRVCAPHTLMAAAGEFGKAARVKVTWLVAANDSYFSPAFSRQLADAFRGAGGKADFHVLPAHGSEGHWLAETEGGVKLAARRTRSRLEGAIANPGEEAMTLYFLVKYLHVLGAIVILGTGTGIAFFMLMAHRSRDAAFIARTAGDRRDRRHAVHADGGAAAAGERRRADVAVLDRVERALADDLARALCGRGAVLGACDLHADRNARSRARRRPRKTRRCRRVISHFSTAGFCSGFPVLALSWLFSG